MLGGWVNPHREQQTVPQGQTSLPPKSFSTPTANGQSAPRTGSARGVGRRGEPHTEHGLGVLLALRLALFHPQVECGSGDCGGLLLRHVLFSHLAAFDYHGHWLTSFTLAINSIFSFPRTD